MVFHRKGDDWGEGAGMTLHAFAHSFIHPFIPEHPCCVMPTADPNPAEVYFKEQRRSRLFRVLRIKTGCPGQRAGGRACLLKGQGKPLAEKT